MTAALRLKNFLVSLLIQRDMVHLPGFLEQLSTRIGEQVGKVGPKLCELHAYCFRIGQAIMSIRAEDHQAFLNELAQVPR